MTDSDMAAAHRTTAHRTTAPSARPAFRLRGTAYKTMLVLHVLTSVGWFGLAVAVVFCWIAAEAAADQGLAHALYLTIAQLPWLTVPVGLAAIITGGVLGLWTRYGLIRYWWVIIKIIIAVAVVVSDGLLTGESAHVAAVGHTSEPVLYGSTTAHVVVLALAAVLSVFKPIGRTPWRRRSSLRATTALL
jgi:hypothetical protein